MRVGILMELEPEEAFAESHCTTVILAAYLTPSYSALFHDFCLRTLTHPRKQTVFELCVNADKGGLHVLAKIGFGSVYRQTGRKKTILAQAGSCITNRHPHTTPCNNLLLQHATIMYHLTVRQSEVKCLHETKQNAN